MVQRPMPPCFRRIPGTAGLADFGGVSEISRPEGLEREMRSRPFFFLGQAVVSRIVLIWVFPAKRVRSLAWGTGAVTMAVWITNAQATGATVMARAGQTRTNHPTAGAQPLRTCALKAAMRAIATAANGRPLIKASRRRAAFRVTSTPKPTSTKSAASCSMPASRRLPWRSSPSARRSHTCRCFPATCTLAWATWGSTWSKPT